MDSTCYLVSHEDKITKRIIKELKLKLKFNEVFYVEIDGLLGGFALVWNKEIFIQVVEANLTTPIPFAVKVQGPFWDSTFIYGNPNFSERRYL